MNKNIEVYNNLTEETKEYLRVAFSFVDYLNHNTIIIKMKDESGIDFEEKLTEKSDILSLAFFMAGLYASKEIKTIFGNYDIKCESLTGLCKKEDYPFEIVDSIELAESFNDYDLSDMIINIMNSLNSNYKIPEGTLSVADINPEIFFDYMLTTYYEIVEDILGYEFGIDDLFDSDVLKDYSEFIFDREKEILNKHNVEYNEDDFQNIKEYYFSNGISLIFDNGALYFGIQNDDCALNVPVIHAEEGRKIKLHNMTRISTINGVPTTKKNVELFIEELPKETFCKFTIIDNKSLEDINFTIFREDLFKKGIPSCINKTEENEEENENEDHEAIAEVFKNKNTPNLNKYSSLMNEVTYYTNPSIGRDKELDEMEVILLYPKNDKSIVITGEAGVGKTALVEGLCYRIQNGLVCEELKGIKIYKINASTLTSGTKYVGELEKKMESILKEIKGDKNIVLFIDELHQTMNAGKAENSDNSVSEILKPYLDRGDVRIIGASTNEEYASIIEPDAAFKTRLSKVSIKEPDNNTLFKIIDSRIDDYNGVSNLKVEFDESEREKLIEGLIEATKNSFRDYKDKANNPRLVLGILERAYAFARFEKSNEVTVNHICKSIMSEDRLYPSSRENSVKAFISKMNIKKDKSKCNNVLQFRLKK